MKEYEHDSKLTAIYRDWFASEISDEEIAREKRAFIAAHFSEAPVAVLQPVMMVPAMCLFAFFAWFGLQFMRLPEAPHAAKALTQDRKWQEPAEVRRLTSEVGPTLVYQKSYQEKPITIIWVFQTIP
ncbi:MAG: hypothetical protein Q8R76_09935 [Candidatus Omnitrophota bacterium]|nr:hypothetical protein [Candidatus Omnitrophota bacterium]